MDIKLEKEETFELWVIRREMMRGLDFWQGLQGSRGEHAFQAHFKSRNNQNCRCGEGEAEPD